MQKKLKSLLMAVSCVAAATLVFIACGNGDVILIGAGNDLQANIMDSDLQLQKKVGDKDTTIFGENYEPPIAVSSSEVLPVSSSIDNIPSSSSNYEPPPPPPVSSSLTQLPSSSSAAPPPPSSSSSARSSSAGQAVSGGCRESSPKAGVTCAWNHTGVLTPGTVLKPAAFTLPTDCQSVAWKFAPDTVAMALSYECTPTDENGFAALGSKQYVLFAELTCTDGKHTNACNPKTGLSSKLAPELKGDCVWSKNPTTTARGAIPSGVSVVDTDHICTSPTVVYKYAGGAQTWPTTGILSDWKNWDKKHKETYSDVEATLNCPAYSQPVTTLCPALEVSAGADYIIECTGKFDDAGCGGAAKKTVNLKLDECVEINVMGYTDQYNTPTVIMRCETQGTQQSASVTVSLNGKSTTTSGSYSVQPLVDLGKIKVGDNEFGTLCVTAISGATSLKCTGPSQ